MGKAAIQCIGCTHIVALVVSPGEDFHWYRRDVNGYWSHKFGSSEATDVDFSGNKITNPETADRAEYTDFCGYFCVDKVKIKIE
jgi:hypothetical protein